MSIKWDVKVVTLLFGGSISRSPYNGWIGLFLVGFSALLIMINL